MSTIHIGNAGSKKVSFNLATLIETRLLVQANSGGGKSWALRRLLEQTHGKVQQIVIDLEGEFSSLRERFDYVIAGKDADAATDPRSAKLLARKLMELQVSAVCDIYELKTYDRVKFVRTFLESLLSCPRSLWHPVMVVLDEAHHWCPEKGQCEAAQAVIDLCTRGRKRGLMAVLATQRLSKLHKDAAAETLNKLVGRTGLDIDQARAADELGITGKADRRELRNLHPGEFHAYGPALRLEGKSEGGVVLVKIGDVQSTHPHVGARRIDAPPAPTDAIRKILSELKDLPEQADKEARDLVTLQRDLAEARREITRLQSGQAPVCDHEDEIDILQRALLTEQKNANEASSRLTDAVSTLGATTRAAIEAAARISKVANALTRPLMIVEQKKTIPAPAQRRTVERKEGAAVPVPRPTPSPAPDCNITGPQQKILDGLATFETIGMRDVNKSTLAGYIRVSARSSGYTNNLSSLRVAGLIDYPSPGHACLTDAGRMSTALPEYPPSLSGLHESWLSVFSSPQANILRALIAVWPSDMAKTEIAERVGVSFTSSGFTNNLSRLKVAGVVEYSSPGRARASQLLFPEGLA